MGAQRPAVVVGCPRTARSAGFNSLQCKFSPEKHQIHGSCALRAGFPRQTEPACAVQALLRAVA